jgi:hypothetical protein
VNAVLPRAVTVIRAAAGSLFGEAGGLEGSAGRRVEAVDLGFKAVKSVLIEQEARDLAQRRNGEPAAMVVGVDGEGVEAGDPAAVCPGSLRCRSPSVSSINKLDVTAE